VTLRAYKISPRIAQSTAVSLDNYFTFEFLFLISDMRWIALLSLASMALGTSTKLCPDRVLISSSLLTTESGITINQTIYDCPSVRANALANAGAGLAERATDVDIEKRQVPSPCNKLPVQQCKCRVLCDTASTCFVPRHPITSNDCGTLSIALIFSNQTFTSGPGQFTTYSIGGTCQYGILNNTPSSLFEFCLNSMGNAGQTLNSNCPNQEASCGAQTLFGISQFLYEQIATIA